MITRFHAKYYAYLLTQQSIGDQIDSLSQSLLNASVDINPHQIEAALFAFKSPLSKGIMLADEVGLGKTVEAGLVICQYWATGKRKILIICPATLRKQWSFELIEKFGIANEILDTKNYNAYLRNGLNPFEQRKAVICSYNFAARKKDEIQQYGFDLAVIDEAHKLRNVYKKNSKTSHAIKDALCNVKKLLLTATPFQNSLMELYGLTSIIDDNIFGDARSFRSEYVYDENITDLRCRMKPYYKRTLRKDVKEYINYTKRLPITQQFDSTDLETQLYNEISDFLRREDVYSVPTQQRMLTTMIIRKILASSTYALIGTLTTIRERLVSLLANENAKAPQISDYISEEEMEIFSEDFDEDYSDNQESESQIDIEKLKTEISTIESFIETAKRINHDSKSEALLLALEKSFCALPAIGANRKALIFTESTRTQKYLFDYLSNNGYRGKIVTFNGSNNTEESNRIYTDWCRENYGNGKISGIKAADKRAAIIDYFRNHAEIMIATEAAAEGLNLQFCSLVVNYDLPWNPQRIEQRIGRCHRYGQKCDVVVVNFVNERNYADKRVFGLLNEKFHLFNDVFGASDDILGHADAIDFEKRIWQIYQECRTEEEINTAFEKLQNDLQEQINDKIENTINEVLENFDIDVQEKLRLAKQETSAFLNRYELAFWELTKYILSDKAVFDNEKYSFELTEQIPNCAKGRYELLSKLTDGIPYRLSSPLGQYVIQQALAIPAENGGIIFREDLSPISVTVPVSLRGKSGYLILTQLCVSAFDDENYCLFTAFTDDGRFLSQEECEKLFLLGGLETPINVTPAVEKKLAANSGQHIKSKLQSLESRDLAFFKEEEERIFRWENDLINSIEKELDTVKRQIREQERQSRQAENLDEKTKIIKKIQELERAKRKKRIELADREDEVSEKRRTMLEELDRRKVQHTRSDDIFIISWQIQ